VTVRSVRPTLNVSDVHASPAWFEQLGWKTTFTSDDSFGGTGCGDEGERRTWVCTFRVGAFIGG
jgi:hypothetical protein